MPTHDDIERLGAIRAHANRWLPPQTDAEVAKGIKDCQFLIGLIDEYRKLWSDLSKEMIDQQTLDPKHREVREKWREFRKQSKSDSDIMLCNDSAYHTNQQAYEAGQDSGYKLAMETVVGWCREMQKPYSADAPSPVNPNVSYTTIEKTLCWTALHHLSERCLEELERGDIIKRQST